VVEVVLVELVEELLELDDELLEELEEEELLDELELDEELLDDELLDDELLEELELLDEELLDELELDDDELLEELELEDDELLEEELVVEDDELPVPPEAPPEPVPVSATVSPPGSVGEEDPPQPDSARRSRAQKQRAASGPRVRIGFLVMVFLLEPMSWEVVSGDGARRWFGHAAGRNGTAIFSSTVGCSRRACGLLAQGGADGASKSAPEPVTRTDPDASAGAEGRQQSKELLHLEGAGVETRLRGRAGGEDDLVVVGDRRRHRQVEGQVLQ